MRASVPYLSHGHGFWWWGDSLREGTVMNSSVTSPKESVIGLSMFYLSSPGRSIIQTLFSPGGSFPLKGTLRIPGPRDSVLSRCVSPSSSSSCCISVCPGLRLCSVLYLLPEGFLRLLEDIKALRSKNRAPLENSCSPQSHPAVLNMD